MFFVKEKISPLFISIIVDKICLDEEVAIDL
ncbi:MAG: hypothetical protein ACI9GZ_004340 [Bacteroidia bacterium]|jgi:hypothetical protein